MLSKRIFVYIPLLLSLSSCKKDFLEVQPKGSLIATKTSDYENLFYSQLGLGSDAPSIAFGDEVATLDTYFGAASLRTQRLFKYSPVIYEPEQSAEDLSTPTTSLYMYNKIINEVMNSEGGTLEYKSRLTAEAKALRAYTNMMLMNYYSKPYNAATAASDLGIPLVTVADVSATSFKRATVKEVYESMMGDLQESIPLIPIEQGSKIRICRSAAELVLAKIYWNIGEYEKALVLIRSAKTHYPTGFALAIFDYNKTYANGTWNISSSLNNTESLLVKTSFTFWGSSSNDLLIAPWVTNLYTSTDMRLKSFSATPYLGTGKYPVTGLQRRIGPFGLSAAQGVSLPDVELMKAECEARTGLLDSARTTLTEFRKLRMSATEAPVAITDQNQLIRFVIDERVREMAMYGHRWFDIRRLYNDPLFKDSFHPHIVYSSQTGQASETYTLTPERLVMRYPQLAMNFNPDLINNP